MVIVIVTRNPQREFKVQTSAQAAKKFLYPKRIRFDRTRLKINNVKFERFRVFNVRNPISTKPDDAREDIYPSADPCAAHCCQCNPAQKKSTPSKPLEASIACLLNVFPPATAGCRYAKI